MSNEEVKQIGQYRLQGARQSNELFGTTLKDSTNGYNTVSLTKWSDGKFFLDVNFFSDPGYVHGDMAYIEVNPERVNLAEVLAKLGIDENLEKIDRES